MGEERGAGERRWAREEGRHTRDNETDRSDLSSVDRGGRRLGWSGVCLSLRVQGARDLPRGGSSVGLIQKRISCL